MTSDASGVRAPADSLSELADRLVDTGIPWNTPAADIRHALRDRLLVDVDPVAVAGRERPGVAGRLREADQQQRRPRRRRWSRSAAGRCRGRAAPASAGREARRRRGRHRERRGRTAASRAARRPRARARPARWGPGSAGRGSPPAPRPRPAASSRWCRRATAIHDASSGQPLSPDAVRPGQLRELADDDVDRGSRQEARHDRPRQEPRDPAEAQQRQQEEQAPRSRA